MNKSKLVSTRKNLLRLISGDLETFKNEALTHESTGISGGFSSKEEFVKKTLFAISSTNFPSLSANCLKNTREVMIDCYSVLEAMEDNSEDLIREMSLFVTDSIIDNFAIEALKERGVFLLPNAVASEVYLKLMAS